MRQTALISLLLSITTFSLFAGEIIGTLVTANDTPVADATLVLPELDLITITDESGHFIFEDVIPGEHTMLIIAPAMEEKEITVTSPSRDITLAVSPEVVEMDTIIVTAEAEEETAAVNEGVTSEELERLSVRSDPFDSLTQESGILADTDSNAGGMDRTENNNDSSSPVTIPEGRLSIGQNNEVSVYGGDSDWNNYNYDYIRIPTNTHSFGYPDADAIVPVEAVDSIDIYRGAYPVEYGPGIGGLFTMIPATAGEDLEITLTPSIMDLSALTSWQLTDNLGLTLSLNQSILNYTVVPLMTMVMESQNDGEVSESDNPTSMSYGDFLMRLLWTPPGHSVSLDLMGYYDYWAFDLGVDESSLKSDYGPWYLAAGSKWVASLTPNLSNSLYGFFSLYSDYGDFDIHQEGEDVAGTTEYSTDWVSTVNSVQGGDELIYSINRDYTLLTGINSRFSDLRGEYEDYTLTTDDEETVLNTFAHDITFEDTLFSLYSYSKLLGQRDNLEYHIGSGLLWYPEYGTLRPSLEGEIIRTSDRLSLALTSGWSPGVIDEFSYIDRRLDEMYYDLDSETTAETPPMAISAAAQAVYSLDENNNLYFTPYYSWYYDLTGISISTSYTDLDDSFVALDPSRGYSTGFDVKWSSDLSKAWSLDISYAYSYTRYDTEELGWVSPNTEVTHALKSSAAYSSGRWNWAMNLLLYSGSPFTPETVEESDGEYTVVQDEYNSAVDWMPTYEFNTNLDYTWNRKNYDLSLFFNSGNLLEGLEVSMNGLDPDLEETDGATTADYDSRDYEFTYSVEDLLMALLTCEIGLSFSF